VEKRARPTSNSAIAQGLGGRSGFSGSDANGEAPEPATSKAERVASVRNWHDAINHFEDYEDQNRLRLNRLLPSYELLVAIGIVLVFVGGYAAFIAFLALTR
jgi:hypothetical protein